MIPIPVSWLIHTAVLSTPERDDYGNEADSNPITLRRVRLEPSGRMTIDKNGVQRQCVLTLFIDARNSQPRGVLPSVGQIVSRDGGRYRVMTVDPLYDQRRLHHVECGLEEV